MCKAIIVQINIKFYIDNNNIFYMSNYEELISKINNENDQIKTEAFKKLIYLSVNDQNNFQKYSFKILQFINNNIDEINNQDTKLLSLQLLSELVTNYKSTIPKSKYQFARIVNFLSDQKPQIRKASHYLFLTYVKKYSKFDQILKSFQQILKREGISWKLVQKIIHSFQSLIIVEPKSITYSQNYQYMDRFIKFLLQKTSGQNNLLKKASEQALTSFAKNEYVVQVIDKLNEQIYNGLKQYCKLTNILLIQKNLPYALQSEDLPQVELKLSIKQKSLMQYQKKQINDQKQYKFVTQKELYFKKQQQQKIQTNPSILILKQLIQKMQTQNQWNIKCSAVQQTYSFLLSQKLPYIPPNLIERVIDLTFDFNFKTCITSLNIIHYLTSKYYQELKDYQKKIQDILIEKICDMKLAIRQISTKIIKQLYFNKNTKIIKGLLQKLQNCSVMGKQEILNLLQQIYNNDKEYQFANVVAQISQLLYNQNTRIKIKAIDCLVKICLSTDLDVCKRVLSKKLNKVYYDMFIQRLKQKNGQKWQDKNRGSSCQVQKVSDKLKIQSNNLYFTKKQKQENKFFLDKTESQQKYTKDQTFYETKNTNTIYTNNTQNTLSSKKQKIKAENYREQNSGLKIFDIHNNKQQIQQNQLQSTKSYQYKPSLAKKHSKNIEEAPKQQQLIILSKQYQHKNTNQTEKVQQKKQQEKNKFKFNPKPFITKKSVLTVTNQQQNQQKIQTKPLTKKSTKNQARTIDYKATQYLAKQELQPTNDPQKMIKNILVDIKKDEDWSKQFQALNNIRRILKHHQNYYSQLVTNLSIIMQQVLKLVESLRSSLAKNAMITLYEMCQTLRKGMDGYLEPIIGKLMKKSLDTNIFIAQQVKKCLISLCHYCNINKIIISVLNNSQTKQNQVKLNLLLVIQKLLENSDNKLSFLKQNNKLVGIIGAYILDSSSEVRNYTKNIFISTAKQYSKPQIQLLLKRNVNQEAFNKLKNILDKQLISQQLFLKTAAKKLQ